MSDLSGIGPEGETPVNPYNLLEAVNETSDDAHMGWLIFLAIMTYLMIAVTGVTHKDLLLQTPVELPILQVKIPLTEFFQFAPVVLVLFHLGLITQLTLLARKIIEFDGALRLLETSDRRNHPLRLELHNFFFVQAIAGPDRSLVVSAFLHGMSWLTLVVLPVLMLLYIQAVFLPYHSVPITWIHRAALLVDMGLLSLLGVFLARKETSFGTAFIRNALSRPITFLFTSVLLVLVALVSLFIATIPGERLDGTASGLLPLSAPVGSQAFVGGYAAPFSLARSDGSLLGIFRRNLDIRDQDLVDDKADGLGQATLNLRYRDLRFARFDRSDLHRADMTGADVEGASFVASDLRGVVLLCADATSLLLTENRQVARCASAQKANFSRAQLTGAKLAGADLSGSVFDETQMTGADLSQTVLTGASFRSAHLERAELTGGAHAEGANFLGAVMTGADLTGARLTSADFTGAAMQGVSLARSGLDGARLRDADLEAASLVQATLYAADFSGARIANADFHGAFVWQTQAPGSDPSGLADFTDIVLRPMDDKVGSGLKVAIDRVGADSVKAFVRDAVAIAYDPAERNKWSNGGEAARWQSAIQAAQTSMANGYKSRLTEALTRMMCKPRWSTGNLAAGIARRSQAQQFRGDPIAIYDRLRSDDCPAGKAMPQQLLKDFATFAEQLRAD